MKTNILAIFIFLVVTSCDTGNKNGDTEIETNTSGFPNVAGTYAFTTGEIDFTCSDGGAGSVPAISQNTVVSQVNNVLTMSQPEGVNRDVPGITIIEEGDTTGTVTTSGRFTSSKFMTAYFDQLDLNGSIQYSVTGVFSNSGWSGDYRFIVTFIDIILSCDYRATFSGSKININSKPVKASTNKNINYESEIYLDISKFGAFQ